MWATRTSSGAAPIGPRRRPCRRPCRLPPRIHTVPHAATRCTPDARRVTGHSSRRPGQRAAGLQLAIRVQELGLHQCRSNDGLRPEHPVPALSAHRPAASGGQCAARAAVIPTARVEVLPAPDAALPHACARPRTDPHGRARRPRRSPPIVPSSRTPPARTLSQSSVQENPSMASLTCRRCLSVEPTHGPTPHSG